jgi:hypothetical protein
MANRLAFQLTFTTDRSGNLTGGRIELVVDRASLTPAVRASPQFDNMTVAADGSVLIQEDSGNVPYLAKTWLVDPAAKTAKEVLQSDPERFAPTTPPAPGFLTQDEESSGIIEVTEIVRSARWSEHGRRYLLADMQAHYGISGELVEGGQLYLIASPRQRGHFIRRPWWDDRGEDDGRDHDDSDDDRDERDGHGDSDAR